MQKLIRIEPSKCVGCKSCELACSFSHSSEFAPSRSRIFNEVFLEEAKFITVTCIPKRSIRKSIRWGPAIN
jgi:anaerobic carbon-monoxide dehydrogenase iron sulfur subunit